MFAEDTINQHESSERVLPRRQKSEREDALVMIDGSEAQRQRELMEDLRMEQMEQM